MLVDMENKVLGLRDPLTLQHQYTSHHLGPYQWAFNDTWFMNRINSSAGHIWNFSISPQQLVLLYTPAVFFPLINGVKFCVSLHLAAHVFVWLAPLRPDLLLSSFSPSLCMKASFRWRGEQERKKIGGREETLTCVVAESEMKANGKCSKKGNQV